MDYEVELKKQLEFRIEATKMWHQSPAILETFLLRNARFWKGSPYTGKRGVMKECFKNSFELALHNPKLRYVEGLAVRLSLGISMDHAWCIDEDNNVVDCTWDQPEEAVYFGVDYDIEVVRQKILQTRTYGLYWTGAGMLNAGFLAKRDPDMIPLFSENVQNFLRRDMEKLEKATKRKRK